jgi:hypothetical protein
MGGKEKGAFMAVGPLYGGLMLSHKLIFAPLLGRRGSYGLGGLIGILRTELKGAGERERPGSLLNGRLSSFLLFPSVWRVAPPAEV